LILDGLKSEMTIAISGNEIPTGNGFLHFYICSCSVSDDLG
jgi:hypothetical protein